MNKDELLQLFDEFINQTGQVGDFNDFLEKKGYSEDEYDVVMESIDNN